MIRKIIHINEEKCNGCGACAAACHEGAIGMIGGKARLLRDDYCDGLGDCLPACPTGAITFVEREAMAYDEKAVLKQKEQKTEPEKNHFPIPYMQGGCPGSRSAELHPRGEAPVDAVKGEKEFSCLRQWPVQIKLAPVRAPYFEGASLLIAADCSAYAYGDFHNKFMRGKLTLIGCPKLDMVDYTDKLTEILSNNAIKSVTVVRMEVPCCGGIENAVKNALQRSGKCIPWQVVTLSTSGHILDE